MLSQQSYIEKVLKRFSMIGAKPVSFPLASHFNLSTEMSAKIKEEMEKTSSVQHSSVIGSIIVMVCTHPKISHDVSVVSRYIGNE